MFLSLVFDYRVKNALHVLKNKAIKIDKIINKAIVTFIAKS